LKRRGNSRDPKSGSVPRNGAQLYAVLATSFDLDTAGTQYATAPINDITLKSSKRMFTRVD